ADIYEVADGQRLGQGQVEGAPDSVLMLADRLATDVLRVILRKGDGEVPRIDLASVTTASFPALKAYLEGEVLFRRSDFDASIEAYRRAVEADSTFALAYYRLSEAYGWSESIWSESAGEMLERAARLAHRLPERDALFVRASLALHRFTLDGLEPMRQAVRKYPEDPEAWFLLGDTYYHLGQAALVSLEETERALTRAVEIEPRFMPYRIHPVDLAFWHADSALAAQRIDDYQRLAPDAGFAHTSRRAFALAFGDSAVHAQARAGLNTLEVAEIWRLQGYFFHPRHAAERETVLNTTRRRDDVLKTRALIRLFDASMTRGRLQEGLEYLADPMTAADGRVCGVYEVHIRGLPVTDERLESTLAFSEHDTIPRTGMLCIGAYAADRGRWADHSGAVENLRRQAQSALGVGDSAEAGFYAALAQALEGYALWKRGQPDAALRTLTNAQPNASAAALDWLGLTHAEPVRWWLGQLYLELDRPRDAEPYFRSLWWDPLAHYYLGTIYEEQQEFDRARDAYSYFVESWRDADPELRPLVERGRRGLIRVTGVRRE
ncbi:MAG: tetratricopeptide repeat protein, partial [Gemmatimonadetes bacterium]|nr:tetratricopeptide repeat protein [Gemmatimonadota bacterium]